MNFPDHCCKQAISLIDPDYWLGGHSMSVMAIYHQSSTVRGTATAASRALLALPHSASAAAVTDEQLV